MSEDSLKFYLLAGGILGFLAGLIYATSNWIGGRGFVAMALGVATVGGLVVAAVRWSWRPDSPRLLAEYLSWFLALTAGFGVYFVPLTIRTGEFTYLLGPVPIAAFLAPFFVWVNRKDAAK